VRQRLVRILLIVLVVLLNIGCDQVTKVIARNTLRGRGTVRVVGETFVLRYVENEGAFLSFGSGWPTWARRLFLMGGPAVLVIVLLVYVFWTKEIRTVHLVAYCCIIGGGLSNLIDRLIYGGRVTDFMNLGIGNLRTGIFNVADLSVLFGAGLLLFTLGFRRRTAEKAHDGGKDGKQSGEETNGGLENKGDREDRPQ